MRSRLGASRGIAEDGNASLAVIGGVAFVMALSLLVADLTSILIARAQAQTAADAAALAAAAETLPGSRGSPQSEASRFATANGATLVACQCSLGRDDAIVEVEVGVRFLVLDSLGKVTVGARARAESDLSLLRNSSDQL